MKPLTHPEAVRIAGRLSAPSKMPGFAYGLPAQACKLGRKLKAIPGSVCSKCYALRGNYKFPKVAAYAAHRLKAIRHKRWVEAMVLLCYWAAKQKSLYFRWHDSGDLQSVEHLEKIVEIARRLPVMRFWLPTQEYGTVQAYRERYGPFPSNLTVRLTAHLIDKPGLSDLPMSAVHTEKAPEGAHACPAKMQFNHCDTCRACWDSNVRLVSYPLH
jgi:hypothetical protein